MAATQFRLVTRSDFDGLVCGVLLKELNLIDEITFVHPKDMQDGKVAISVRDITTNLPYSPDVAVSFDHHSSEDVRVIEDAGNRVAISSADSAARVVYEYFGGAQRFPRVSEEIMEAVDSGVPLAQSDPEAETLGTIAELAAGLEDRLLRAAGRNPAAGLARKAPV